MIATTLENGSGSSVKLSWKIDNFKHFRRERLIAEVWPYCSSGFSLPQDAEDKNWYLKVTDNIDYLITDKRVSGILKDSMVKQEENFSGEEEWTETRSAMTIGGVSTFVVVYLSYPGGEIPIKFHKLVMKVNGLIWMENNQPTSIDHFVKLNPTGDLLISIKKLNYTQFENTNLNITLEFESEPCPTETISPLTNSIDEDLLIHLENSNSESNIIFKGFDGSVSCNQTWLELRSRSFRTLLAQNPNGLNQVFYNDCSIKVLRHFVEYLRTNRLSNREFDDNEIDGILDLANKYDIQSLIRFCEVLKS
ncbi:hypothetical protein HDE_08789 [Halotydeus destructor]|nr:hypothetical protein HDE_08789 [Halotydeus destructor]